MGRAGGGHDRRDGEITWTVGGSPIGYHNAVVECAASPERADTLITEWRDELHAAGLPGSWHVSPMMTPDDLVERLIANGSDDGGEEPAMSADLTRALPEPPRIDGLSIARASDDAGLDAYRRVLGRGFGEDRKSTRLNSSHRTISYAVFCLKK